MSNYRDLDLKEDLSRLVDELNLSEKVTLPDIEINLYMDQLLKFLNEKLKSFKRGEKPPLSKTMINNYTKGGLLNPPKNKKYNREHIILLILVYNLKNILSISDIKTLFAPILKNMDKSEVNDNIISLEDIYSVLMELKEDEYEEFKKTFNENYTIIKEKTSNITNERNQDMAELFLTVIMLTAQANACKRMAEKIIDNYFKPKE